MSRKQIESYSILLNEDKSAYNLKNLQKLSDKELYLLFSLFYKVTKSKSKKIKLKFTELNKFYDFIDYKESLDELVKQYEKFSEKFIKIFFKYDWNGSFSGTSSFAVIGISADKKDVKFNFNESSYSHIEKIMQKYTVHELMFLVALKTEWIEI